MIKNLFNKLKLLSGNFTNLVKQNTNTASRRRFLGGLLTGSGVALIPGLSHAAKNKHPSGGAISPIIDSTLRADFLFTNGHVITLDGASNISEAIAIRGSKIIAVGKTAELEAQTSPETQRIDLKGRSVLPGFFDTHPHMDREGLKSLGGESLADADSVAAIVERVAEAASKAKPEEWIVFMPMGAPPFDYVNNPKLLKEGRFPNRHDLDRVAPNNPVYIRSVWGWWTRPPFPAVANSQALRRCGITAATVDPYNINIERDRSGNPTGVFLETNRTSLLEHTLFRDLPRFSYGDRLESIRIGSKIYNGFGTTSAYEAHGLTPDLLRAYREIDERGELSVRMSAALSLPASSMSRERLIDVLDQWAPAAGGRGMSSGNFRVSGVTLDHADPKIAAAVAADYPNVQWAGKYAQGITESEFVEIGIEAAKRKLRLNFVIATSPYHDIDRKLDMLEKIDREASIKDLRCVGFHMINATPKQLRRIRELGLVITMTPSFIYSQAAELRLDKLGQDACPMREVLDAGIPLTLGSDNVPPSMFFTAWEALVRWDEIGQQYLGKSRLEREEVLRMCCQNPHYLNWEEDSRGIIAAGMAAELMVYDADPLSCDINLLPQLTPVLTMLDGRIVYDAGS
jgi:predicted amidohydrolase YtcJ